VADILRIPVDRELRDRVTWLVTFRWFALLFAALVLIVANSRLGGVLPMAALCYSLAGVGLYNLAFHLLTRRLTGQAAPPEVHGWLMHAQVVADLVALTIILHFSGGLENPFSVYYVLFVAVGSILTTKRASYAYATAATLLWAGLLVSEAVGLVAHHNLVGFRSPVRYEQASHIVAEAVILGTANFGVAHFASSIIERLRERETQLYQANASCELRAGELRELNRRLQEFDRTRAFFIRLVTHELRAPVAAIKSYLRLILDGYVPQERLTEIIAKTEQRAGDQLELIEDLLELARIQEPKTEKCEPVNVASVLDDVIDMLQARIEDRRVKVTLDVGSAPCIVLADRDHIKQVWTNLISNAIKYTPEGGEVSVALRRLDGGLRGEVADTGIGIKPADQAHIFDTFYRTEEAKAMCRQGTGLGLSIVRGVVDLYGGRVWVESVPGRGSTFYFELPVALP